MEFSLRGGPSHTISVTRSGDFLDFGQPETRTRGGRMEGEDFCKCSKVRGTENVWESNGRHRTLLATALPTAQCDQIGQFI